MARHASTFFAAPVSQGIWFEAGQDDTSFAGLFGYKVFLTIGADQRLE